MTEYDATYPGFETDEDAYNDVADELNDYGSDMTLADLNEDGVAAAERYAAFRGLSWPPERGDYDRQYDWLMGRRAHLARLEDQAASEARWAADDARIAQWAAEDDANAAG